MAGIESIAAGMQDIEPATRGASDLPGGNAATSFSGRVQAYIYIIVLGLLFIVKSQVADGAVLDKAFFHIRCMEVLISMYKPYVLQQLIEDPELFGVLFLASGVFYKMNNEVGSDHTLFTLKKRELRVIAQPVGEQ